VAAALDPRPLEDLRRAAGEDAARRVVETFLASAPERIGAALRAHRTGDDDGALHALHALASSAAMVGATVVARLAREGQEPTAEERRSALLDRLQEAWPEAEAALRLVLDDFERP
jgi:HPt (histidine-containing phosphotransfer) domain-containing protein